MTTAVVNNVDKKEQRVKNVFRIIMMQSGERMKEARWYAEVGLSFEGEGLEKWVKNVLAELHCWRGDEARR